MIFASAGHALRWLHQAPAPSAARQHDARAEIEVLRRWIRRLETLRTKTSRDVRRSAGAVMRALRAGDSPAGFLHRDFHDKQVFLERDGRAGFLDFDAAAVGERALDVANMLVHLELRTIQGLWTARIAVDAGSAFLDGYAPTDPVRSRLLAYADATRLRLACLYAFRPPWPEVSDALLGRIGSGLWSRI
jgi:aminoglycoside phosphotransferase (APT) family kinase protein